jgi:hypothetical protein
VRTRRTSRPAHRRLDPVERNTRDLGAAIPSDAIEALLAAHRIVLPNHNPAVSAPQLLGAISTLVQCSATAEGRDRRPSYRRAPLGTSAPALASAGRNVHSQVITVTSEPRPSPEALPHVAFRGVLVVATRQATLLLPLRSAVIGRSTQESR